MKHDLKEMGGNGSRGQKGLAWNKPSRWLRKEIKDGL